MIDPHARIDLSGPFFERDPKKTVRGNIRRMLVALADEGQRVVQERWPVDTGAGREGTRGRVESLSGKEWGLHAVISATHVYPWPGGGERQYRGGKAERKNRMFRAAAMQIRQSRAVLNANLVEGLE